MFEQAPRRSSDATFEAWLQAPDLAHVGGVATLDRELLGLRVEHDVHRGGQRRDRIFAACLAVVPRLEHLVPHQRREQEARRRRLPDADAVVGVLQRQRHEALAERLFEHHVEQRQHAVMQALRPQPLEAGEGVSGHQQLEHLVEQARGRHVLEQRCETGDRLAGRLVDRELELGREAHGPQHPHRILAIALLRVTDHLQRARLHVVDAVVVVDHGLRGRVVEQRVDGEVATGRVFFLRAKDVIAQDAAVLVGHLQRTGGSAVASSTGRRRDDLHHRRSGRCDLRGGGGAAGTEGRDLDRVGAEHHVHEAEAAADDVRATEQALDLLGRGIGRDVEVLRLDVQQQVAHRAADDEGLEAGVLQGLGDARRVGRHQLRVDAVRGRRHHHRPDDLAATASRGAARLGGRARGIGLRALRDADSGGGGAGPPEDSID